MEMLTLARVDSAERESSSATARPQSDLAGSLCEAMQQFASFAELREVSMRVDGIERTPVGISAEDSRLLCTNLLLNALQHSRVSTEVSVTLGQREGWATLIIEDQGEGISPESLPHVFEPFYRGDASRNRGTGSTGLGLAICKGICERARGEISIQSRPGSGTVVDGAGCRLRTKKLERPELQPDLRSVCHTGKRWRPNVCRTSIGVSMLRTRSLHRKASAVAGFALAFAACLPMACRAEPAYRVLNHWVIGGEGGWDYMTMDVHAHRLYLAHNETVDVVDTETGKKAGAITGLKGTHGVALGPDGKYGYISDGRGDAIVVFDRHSLEKLAMVPAGTNPDGIAYEPVTRTVWAFNGRSSNASVLDTATRKIVATIQLPGKPEFPVADGRGFVFDNIESKNEIVKLDARTNKVVGVYPLAGCESPSGLAIDRKGRRLLFRLRQQGNGASPVRIQAKYWPRCRSGKAPMRRALMRRAASPFPPTEKNGGYDDCFSSRRRAPCAADAEHRAGSTHHGARWTRRDAPIR